MALPSSFSFELVISALSSILTRTEMTAGFTCQATVRGEQLLVALFTLDQAGLPQPANGAAEALLETGWTS